ncbi:Radical SAM domain protein [Clostridium sp. DL-VIII]|uniref:radical SAM/SPASM domain-containing protein n=1 Tax=Clostridium sp. DL-VIII TaxID=641107 RepID=UPI00023B089F|nr:radical SAM protein [Clostridium sp. DL-VIII]EHJ01703.1 Radical SAM domain protein [Clostridium sp. DL-VIII]
MFNLNKVIFETSVSCSLNCYFCNKDNASAAASCFCKRWNYDCLISNYKKLVEDVIKLGVQKIIILGGDPFYNLYVSVKDIVTYANDANFCGNISIFTNGYFLDKNVIEELSKFKNIKVNINFLGYNKIDYKMVTNQENIFDKVINNVLLMKKYNIPISGTMLINRYSASRRDKDSKISNLNIPIGEKILYTDELLSINAINAPYDRMIDVNYISYEMLANVNPCLYRQLFIASNGKVYVCPYLRDFELGDLNTNTLPKILSQNSYREYWYISKSKIKPCNKCKYRIQCFDCRAIEYSATKNLKSEFFCNIAKKIM